MRALQTPTRVLYQASVFQQTELYMLIYMHTYCVCVYVYVCMYAYYVAKGIRMSAFTT